MACWKNREQLTILKIDPADFLRCRSPKCQPALKSSACDIPTGLKVSKLTSPRDRRLSKYSAREGALGDHPSRRALAALTELLEVTP